MKYYLKLKSDKMTIICANVVIMFDNKILLVKRAKDELEGNLWSLPGGLIEENESIREGLNREIIEELNINLSKDLIFIDYLELFNNNKIVAFYFLQKVDYLPQFKLKLDEITEYKWVKPESIDILAFEQEKIIKKVLSLI